MTEADFPRRFRMRVGPLARLPVLIALLIGTVAILPALYQACMTGRWMDTTTAVVLGCWRGEAAVAAEFPGRFRVRPPQGSMFTRLVWAVPTLTAAAGLLVLWAEGAPVPWPLALAAAVLLVGFPAGLAYQVRVAGRRFVRVGPTGLLLDPRGWPPVVSGWDDREAMLWARRLLVPGWLTPWRLDDPAGFLLAVERYAGAGHPLALALAGEPEEDG